MNYQETLKYLFTCAPMFQQVGSSAYKEGLENTYSLDNHFDHPHKKFHSIHIAGTNGKGSCSHTLAAILQSAGYKVGLYTSPHLRDFKERIRINGTPIDEQYVVDFVEKEKYFFEPLQPSFFELTTAMAFKYFAEQHVDVAVIEVGLGGRLDCTNIITPDLSVITNISFDHMQFLGNTLEAIAKEKAGIIKHNIPIIIGETTTETKTVFLNKAKELQSEIIFAEEKQNILKQEIIADGIKYQTSILDNLFGELGGLYQIKNANTILTIVNTLRKLNYNLSDDAIREGFAHVCALTGLEGRWQHISTTPRIVCDTAHNVGGFTYIVKQLKMQKYEQLHIVFGMVNDKDINGVLALLPDDAKYYFTRASVKRALSEEILKEKGTKLGLQGECYPDVSTAINAAIKQCDPCKDFIYVGGSSYIVSDLLTTYDKKTSR